MPASQTNEQGARFQQRRIALLAKVMFGVFCTLELFVAVGYLLWPTIQSEGMGGAPGLLLPVCVVTLAAVWLLARRDVELSPRFLLGLDAATVLAVSVAMAAGIYFASDKQYNIYVPLLFAAWLVFGRSLMVPSTAGRTAALSTLGMAPLVCAGVAVAAVYPERTGMPTPLFVLGMVFVAAVTASLATVGSRVIYGLRQHVRKAMELGQYTLGERLGAGAMGEVYKAHHAMLRRPAAIKLLPLDKAAEHMLERFEREVQLTSELTHPNTIAVFDYGRSSEGVFYYVMEYLDGIDLSTLVENGGGLPPERVIHLLKQVCAALDEAHDRGLIHRDIKAANVMLCRRGKVADFVKVLDFGLVIDLQSDNADAKTLAGTPVYLSPEVIDDPTRIQPTADIYAVGVLGCYLLTGQPLFDGTLEQVLYDTAVTAPRTPSEQLGRAVPNDLEALLMHCVEKKPDDRPPSARALCDRLEALQDAQGWTDELAQRWWDQYEATRGHQVLPTDDVNPHALTIDLNRTVGG